MYLFGNLTQLFTYQYFFWGFAQNYEDLQNWTILHINLISLFVEHGMFCLSKCMQGFGLVPRRYTSQLDVLLLLYPHVNAESKSGRVSRHKQTDADQRQCKFATE
jgi:hypothetical protein